MTASKFLAQIEKGIPVLADGAMGTAIHSRGVNFSQCFDALNLTDPALIAQIHQDYIEAGAEIILTNTFGSNRYRLARNGLGNQVKEINYAGAKLAMEVVNDIAKKVFVAGDVGPLGVQLAPFGRVQLEQAREAFREQISALVESGVDLILLETFSDLYEIREAVSAAREVCTLPVIASMTFTRDDLTLLGTPPEKVSQTLSEARVDVVGVNCSGGPSQILRILNRMKEVAPDTRFLVKPNAGLPEQVQGRIMYPAGPAYFGEYAHAFRQAGAVVIGGCCGTTPNHISYMRHALDSSPHDSTIKIRSTRRKVDIGVAEIFEPTVLSQKLKAGKFVFAVEMSPPRGISTQKIATAASMLSEAGADVINMADSPRARMRMSPWAVCNIIQQKVGIDTTLHFPTRGRNLLRVQGDLLAAHALNVRNVFVVMGDPTEIGDFPDAMDDYDVVPSGLIKLINQGFNLGVDYAGSDIGQPTSFFTGCALNLVPNDPNREMKVLKRKLNAGADFALTQPVFQPEEAICFIEKIHNTFNKQDFHIMAGMLPLYNARNAAFLHNEVPGINIPENIRSRMDNAGTDSYQVGIEISLEIIETLKPYVQGIYLMPPFGRYEIAADIIESVQASFT